MKESSMKKKKQTNQRINEQEEERTGKTKMETNKFLNIDSSWKLLPISSSLRILYLEYYRRLYRIKVGKEKRNGGMIRGESRRITRYEENQNTK